MPAAARPEARQSRAPQIDLSTWTEVDWADLRAEHLDQPTLVIYPPSYAKDYTLGVLESVHVVKGLEVEVGLRGGGSVEILQASTNDQPSFFVQERR